MKNKQSEFITLLGNYFSVYLPSSTGASPNTITSYKYAFRLLLLFLAEKYDLSPDEITFSFLNYTAISDFLKWIEAERGCCINTRNQRLSALSAFADYAQRRSFEAASCFRHEVNKVPAKKQQKKVRTIFTLEEIKVLLGIPDARSRIGFRDKAILSVMYASGARAQEICNLKVADVKFGEEAATLVLKGKGGKIRQVGIPAAPASILRNYLASRVLLYQYDSFVFSSQTHPQMTVSCIEEIFKKYVSIARRERPDLFLEKSYTPHSMRHSTATHMLEAGVPLIVIRNFLGHASVQTTQIYAEVSQNTMDTHIKGWNERWFGNTAEENPTTKDKYQIPDFLK